MLDLEVLGAGLGELVVREIERATEPLRTEAAALRQRIADLEAREAPKGDKGDAGERGEAGPAGEQGPQGEPGPQGETGANGKDGNDAPPPTDEQVTQAVRSVLEGERSLIAEQVERWFEINPPPTGPKGEPGAPGERGEKGDPGERGMDGKDGQAGPVVVAAIKDSDGELILTLTDGTLLKTGIFDGKNGRDGTDGAIGPSGLGFEDLTAEVGLDGRTLILGYVRGDVRQTFELKLALPVDRGAYQEGEAYQKGDEVTYAGSLWRAVEDTTDRPTGSDKWRLAVRRGRDGKDGKDGERGPAGKTGAPGRDGRSYT